MAHPPTIAEDVQKDQSIPTDHPAVAPLNLLAAQLSEIVPSVQETLPSVLRRYLAHFSAVLQSEAGWRRLAASTADTHSNIIDSHERILFQCRQLGQMATDTRQLRTEDWVRLLAARERELKIAEIKLLERDTALKDAEQGRLFSEQLEDTSQQLQLKDRFIESLKQQAIQLNLENEQLKGLIAAGLRQSSLIADVEPATSDELPLPSSAISDDTPQGVIENVRQGLGVGIAVRIFPLRTPPTHASFYRYVLID